MTVNWDNGIHWMPTTEPEYDECDICEFRAKHNNGVIILCADGIYRCKVCRGESKFPRRAPKPQEEGATR